MGDNVMHKVVCCQRGIWIDTVVEDCVVIDVCGVKVRLTTVNTKTNSLGSVHGVYGRVSVIKNHRLAISTPMGGLW